MIRLLLALIVLTAHAGPLFNYVIANTTIAVLSFFIISGFYMALVLDTKYKTSKTNYVFITNRILRIFPVYLACLVVVVFLAVIKYIFHIGSDDNAVMHYLQYSHDVSTFTFVTNLMNFVARNLTLLITTDYFLVPDKTPGYLLVQQAWTLQLELLFYFFAPIIFRLSRRIFLIAFGIYFLIFFGFIVPAHLIPDETLTYAFLQYILFFLLGIASYKYLYKKIFQKKFSPIILTCIFLFIVFYIVFYNMLPVHYSLPFLPFADGIYYGIFAIITPFIFIFTRSNRIDKWIGDLSYPVYIIHFLVIKLLTNISFFHANSTEKTLLVIIITLGLSYILVRFINQPIDQIRQNRLRFSS